MKRSPQVVDPFAFGANIQALREKRGIRQAELAAAIGVAPNSISYYEKGRSVPSLDLAVQIANYFQVSLDSLLGRDEYASYSNATVKSVAKFLFKLSQLRGVKIRPNEETHTIGIDFDNPDFGAFLGEYLDYVSYLSSKTYSDKALNINDNHYIQSMIDRIPETPIDELQMDTDEFLALYNNG